MTLEKEYAEVTRELRAAMVRRDAAEIDRLQTRQDELFEAFGVSTAPARSKAPPHI